MRKPVFAYAKTKGGNQLHGNRLADQRLCFRYMNSTIPLLPKSEISSLIAIFFCCKAWFVSDLFGNPKHRFLHEAAHTCIITFHN